MKIRFMSTLLFVTAIALTGHAEMASGDTQAFFEKAASSNQFEIEAGRLAAQKAANPQLKAFGQKMVADHSKANQELRSLASRKGMTIPLTMSDDHQKKLDELRSLSPGKDFDQAYRDLMVDNHGISVSLFEDTVKDAQDPEVKAFAAKMLPTIQHHESQAKALPKI
jgi:putative membrane protein